MARPGKAKDWDLTPAADGRRYSKYPAGDPPTTLASWNLPATISVPAGSSVGVRQYTADATGWTIAVTALAAGLTYNSGTERIDAAVTTAASGTATFTLSKTGETDVVATATVALIAQPVLEGDLDFPRLAIYANSNRVPWTEAKLDYISQFDIAELQWFPGITYNGYTPANVPQYIKTKNPNIKLFHYSNSQQMVLPTDGNHDAFQFVTNKIFASKSLNNRYDWWLRTGAGAHVLTRWSATQGHVNHTTSVALDSAGLNYSQWYARYINADSGDSGGDWVQSGKAGTRLGSWDGVFCDDVYVQVSWYAPNGDYNDSGVTDDRTSTIAKNAVISGYTAYLNEWKALRTGYLVTANLANIIDDAEAPLPSAMQTLWDGGICEWLTKAEHWGGWTKMMQYYRRAIEYSAHPELVVFDMGWEELESRWAGTSPQNTYPDHRWIRYFLASCLMDNGSFYGVQGDRPNYDWYDEYDLAGTSNTKWLGAAIDGPQLSAWSLGVYRREFENGLVLVNPRGNGARTVNVGAGWKRFQGVQDPTHNNGQAVSSLTIAEQDGILLVRDV